MSNYLTWFDVIKLHGTRFGIGTKNGVVTSILCNFSGKGQYPNTRLDENTVKYFVSIRTGNVNSLVDAMENDIPFIVFEKIAKNQWKNLGEFKIAASREEPDGYRSFILKKTE